MGRGERHRAACALNPGSVSLRDPVGRLKSFCLARPGEASKDTVEGDGSGIVGDRIDAGDESMQRFMLDARNWQQVTTKPGAGRPGGGPVGGLAPRPLRRVTARLFLGSQSEWGHSCRQCLLTNPPRIRGLLPSLLVPIDLVWRPQVEISRVRIRVGRSLPIPRTG